MVLTFYIIFKETSIAEMRELLKNVKLPFVFAGLASILGYLASQGFAIGIAARCIHIRLRLREMLQYSFIGFFYSGVTPSSSGGQPMQILYMCRDRLSASKTTLVMFITNITYQLSVVLIGLTAFIFEFNYILKIHGGIIAVFAIGVSLNLFMLLLLAGVLFSENTLKKILISAVSFLCKIRIIKKPEKIFQSLDKYLEEFKLGVKLIKENRRQFIYTLLATLLQLILYNLVPFFVFKAFGFNGHSVLELAAISAVLYVSVSMFPLPGSVGAAESGFVLLLTPLFGTAIMPAMLLSRFISFYTMMILCGIVSAYVQLRKPYKLCGSVNTLNYE